MSLIDQALQKAYQQRARATGQTALAHERAGDEIGAKDRGPQATRELYLHKPQVPIRSHFSTAHANQRSSRRVIEPVQPAVHYAPPESFRSMTDGEVTEPLVVPADPVSPAIAPSADAAAASVVDRPELIEAKEQLNYPHFHFHVTTQDALAASESIYFIADESEFKFESAHPSIVPPETLPAAVAVPKVPVAEKVEAEADHRNEVASSSNAVSPLTTLVEPFQVAWEVDQFQLPWACEQAETALATELLAAVRDLPRHDSQVFWVSSLLSGEGRTSIATLLSSLLAKSGHQVLLLQGDCQSPSLAQRMGVALDTGWNPAESFTAGNLSDLCVRSVRENFTILPASNPAGGPRVVSMEPMVALVRQLLPHFPTIVIDAPVGFGHRRVALPETHETEILVQDVRKTPKQAITQILDNVPSLRSRTVRIVQNFVPAIGVGALQ